MKLLIAKIPSELERRTDIVEEHRGADRL